MISHSLFVCSICCHGNKPKPQVFMMCMELLMRGLGCSLTVVDLPVVCWTCNRWCAGWKERENENFLMEYLTQLISDDITVSDAINTLRPRQNGRHFVDDIFYRIFLNERFKFSLKFHWNLFPKVQWTINQHWITWWFGGDQATSHYLNQWWFILLTHICVTWLQWLNIFSCKGISSFDRFCVEPYFY